MLQAKWRAAYLLATLALTVAALSPKPGVTWDEPTYVAQGVQYVGWVRRFLTGHADADDPVWRAARPDHPPLGKLAYGLAAVSPPASISALSAARVVAALLFALLVWLTTYAAHRAFGERVAWLAGGGVLLTPQVLAHAQFAALDLPVTVTWVAAAAVSLAGPTNWRGAISIGFLWALALLTKVNGVFLAGPLFGWGLKQRRMRWREVPALAATAAVTFWIGWPWLWNDVLPRVSAYVLDKQVRWTVPTFYLGHVYNEAYPPWHYPLVLTAATLPLAVFAGVLVGGFVLARERPPAAAWVALHIAFTLGLACLPGVPRYDGTRLFLPAFPFLAIIAAVGLERLLLRIASVPALGTPVAALTLMLAVSSAVYGIARSGPCLLSAFSPLVGGLAGAKRLGLETTFWGDAVTPELLSRVPAGARVGVVPLGIEYVRAVQSAGLLHQSAVPAGEDRCDVVIVVARRSMVPDEFLQRFADSPVIAETKRDGVVLASLLPCRDSTSISPR